MSEKKNKVFQDATQGYITVPETYVDNLIDTEYMQREKSIVQAGVRSIFSGANHDRFSHSLGVFNVGKKVYAAFRKSVLSCVPNDSNYEKLLNRYEVLFSVACLLHDIGHPALSHTLEYIYNHDFIDLMPNASKNVNVSNCASYLMTRYHKLTSTQLVHKTILEDEFFQALRAKEKKDLGSGLKAAPHEIMGAYQILTSADLQHAIDLILHDTLGSEAYTEITDNNKLLFDGYLGFIARMITGLKYDLFADGTYEFSNNTINKCSINSLRNCIISLLNGKFDADSIDYLNRNAHFAGYATNNIDINRLCNAFSVVLENGIFTECIAKSALSSLDGVVQARNFEPKWLYAHHKVAYYNEVLIKYLMKMSGEYIFYAHQEEIERSILKHFFKYKAAILQDILSIDCKQEKYLRKRFGNFTDKKVKCNITNIIKKWMRLQCHDQIQSLASDFKVAYIEADCVYVHNSILNFENFLLSRERNWTEYKVRAVVSCIRYLNDMMSKLKYAFIPAILSPINSLKLEPNGFPHYVLYKTTDAGIEKLLNDIRESELKKIRNINSTDRNWEFKCELYEQLLKEHATRNYRSSLWKSYEEYNLFINSVASGTAFSPKTVHDAFMKLITSADQSLCQIEFEDYKQAQRSRKDNKVIDAIYVNYDDEDVSRDTHLQNYHKVFKPLGKGMIIRLHECKFKSFDDLLIQFDRECVKYGKISLNGIRDDFCFPYIYYSEEEHMKGETKSVSKMELRMQLLNTLKKQLVTYLSENCGKERSMDIEQINFLNGKVIRDPVHGDIFVEEKFLKIIECRAFQRLHRIRQLATANQVFPEAVHTRFAHSLGTFHVMKKIVEHFCDIFKQLGLEYQESEKDVVLAAALLHDIGHGPLSHTFESFDGISKKHEEWTKDIILHDTELGDALKENFGNDFAQQVVDCLNHSYSDKKSLQYIFSELISSELDADRIDYLMRDSLNTGEKFGVFDMQKLISSMMLTEYNGRWRVAVDINALSAVEQFIVGRYNMYSMVYYAPYKLLSETLFKYICEEIVNKANEYAVSKDNDLSKKGQQLQTLSIWRYFSGKSTIDEYLQMDDYSIMYDIKQGADLLASTGDTVCADLLECFLYRRGYKRKHINKDSMADFDKLEKQFKKRFPTLNQDDPFKQFKYSVIAIKKVYKAYGSEVEKKEYEENKGANNNKKKVDSAYSEILVLYNNGEIKPFSESSKFFDKQGDSKILWQTNFVAVYLNDKILTDDCQAIIESNGYEIKPFMENKDMATQIEEFIDSFDLKEHTEIENKYSVSVNVLQNAKSILAKPLPKSYYVEEKKEKRQKDVYFDTKSYVLSDNGYSLRCREVDGKYIFNLKKPGNVGKSKDETQFIRLEFKVESDTNKMSKEIIEFLDKNNLAEELQLEKAASGFRYEDLHEVVQINNDRTSYMVRNREMGDFECEVSIDDVKYKKWNDDDPNNIISDYQIEIELKSSYIYRVNLNAFAEQFCAMIREGVDEPRKSQFSKYVTALQKLGMHRVPNT